MTTQQLDKEIRRHYPHADPHIAENILRAVATLKMPLSYMLALVEGESAFTNVFGHDSVANPVKGGRVTRLRYRLYKYWRKRGKGMQGVGYTQLTWYAYQDEADRLGGCWKAYPNLVVGGKLLMSLIHQHGKEAGAARFNGTGPLADAYGKNWAKRQQIWHERIK